MPETLPAGWQALIDKVHGSTAFAWAWELPLHVDASLHLVARVVAYPAPVFVGGDKFYPWPMEQGSIDANADGDLPQLTLTVANHNGMLAEYLEQPGDERGIMGRQATGYLVDVTDSTKWRKVTFRVVGASMTADAIGFRLEQHNWYQKQVPAERYSEQRCRHRFGAGRCPYVINATATYTTCNRTLADCRLRGLDQVFRGYTKTLPLRFGAFLGIPQS